MLCLSTVCGAGRRWLPVLALAAVFLTDLTPAAASERRFPFDSELLLDADPMRGSKRVPILTIGPKGETLIELWCNSVKAHLVVRDDTVAVLTGPRTERRCDTQRMRRDEELLSALLRATTWQWERDLLVFKGERTVRFRRSTH